MSQRGIIHRQSKTLLPINHRFNRADFTKLFRDHQVLHSAFLLFLPLNKWAKDKMKWIVHMQNHSSGLCPCVAASLRHTHFHMSSRSTFSRQQTERAAIGVHLKYDQLSSHRGNITDNRVPRRPYYVNGCHESCRGNSTRILPKPIWP